MPLLKHGAGSSVNQQAGSLRYQVAQASSLLVRTSFRCLLAEFSMFLTTAPGCASSFAAICDLIQWI
jgi:hypothetical protein